MPNGLPQAVTILIVTIVGGTVAAIVSNEYSSRPIIAYSLSGPDQFYGSSVVTISAKSQNTGHSQMTVVIVIRATNATFVKDPTRPFIAYSDTEARILITVFREMPSPSDTNIDLIPKSGTKTFSVTMGVEKKQDPSEFFAYYFGDIHGYYPTVLKYNQTSLGIFKRVP